MRLCTLLDEIFGYLLHERTMAGFAIGNEGSAEMSWNPTHNPDCVSENPALDTLIIPRARDLGGFEVRRALPSVKRQLVGPFIFLK